MLKKKEIKAKKTNKRFYSSSSVETKVGFPGTRVSSRNRQVE